MWRRIAQDALAPQLAFAEPVVARLSVDERHLDAWPDLDLVPLGLFSAERQALVTMACVHNVLRPRLAALGLWAD